jgi:hypothetical protein
VQETNPAFRLHQIIREIRDLAGSGITLGEAWARALRVDNPDSIDFQVAKASVGQIIIDLHSEVRGLDGIISSANYLRFLPTWTKCMNDSPAGMDQGYDADDIASEMDLQLLDSLSDILNARAPQLMPPPKPLTIYSSAFSL